MPKQNHFNDETRFVIAIRRNDLEKAKHLLGKIDKGKVPAILRDKKYEKDKNLLYAIFSQNRSAVVNFLIREEININEVDDSKNTPLHIAALHNHSGLVERLAKYVNSVNENGGTPLHLAVRNSNSEATIEKLLAINANPNARNKKGQTPLIDMILDRNNKSQEYDNTLKILIEKTNINIQDNYGATALHHAVNNSNTKLVEILLNREKIDHEIKDNYGGTPESIIKINDHTIKQLFERKNRGDNSICR